MADLDIKREETTPHLPPWRQFENLIVDRVPLDKAKEEYTKEELFSISIRKIESIPSEIRIFTDGSTIGTQKDGGAGIHIEDINTGRISRRKVLLVIHGRMCRPSGSSQVASRTPICQSDLHG